MVYARFCNRSRSSRLSLLTALFLFPALMLAGGICDAQNQTNANSVRNVGGEANQALIARGKYIVEGVARCEQCHTPRDNNGELDRNRSLEGAALWLQPAMPTQNWPLKAPRLAGNPPGTDEELVKLLTTGIGKFGDRLRPPMPQFRMSEEDAKAVVAYLKSLSPAPE